MTNQTKNTKTDEIRDVNETCKTRDSRKFLAIENCISRCGEFEAAGPHVIFTIV